MELFGFGPHLVVDGHHASPERLNDSALLAQALSELPALLHLSVGGAPHIERVASPRDEDAGFSAVVLGADCHLAIHTFPARGFLSMDLFSCRDFDVQLAVSYLAQHFELGRFETHFNNRGKEFPQNPQLAGRIVLGEREYLEARLV